MSMQAIDISSNNAAVDVNIVEQQYTNNGFVQGVKGSVDLSIFI